MLADMLTLPLSGAPLPPMKTFAALVFASATLNLSSAQTFFRAMELSFPISPRQVGADRVPSILQAFVGVVSRGGADQRSVEDAGKNRWRFRRVGVGDCSRFKGVGTLQDRCRDFLLLDRIYL